MNRQILYLGAAFFVSTTTSAGAAPLTGYHPKAPVSAPTRLDWTFAVSNRSLADPPGTWLPADYDSTRQTFELFVPPRFDPKKPLPVVVYISPGAEPDGWKAFELACKQLGMIFAAPRGAGNNCPGKQRVRIVLDVLDEVRRNYLTDPDRTYLAGLSGGGRMACTVALALPELFGGVLPICAGGELREETWLRHRLVDRLSVALITGTGDFNRGEVERLRGPFFKDIGVRTRVWTQPGLGHALPNGKLALEALRWLDDGAARRRALAKQFPATRTAGDASPDREAAARALFAEGKKKLAAEGRLYSGLMVLQGVLQRWPDLPEGDEAKKILLEYESRADRPWEKEMAAEELRYWLAQARALDAYASGELAPQYAKMRPDMARQAATLWGRVLANAPGNAAREEAKKRIPVLEKLANKPAE